MKVKIIGFDSCVYGRFNTDEKNPLLSLEDMTPKQRYELALADAEDAVIYDSLEQFLFNMNEDIVNDEYYYYQYTEE